VCKELTGTIEYPIDDYARHEQDGAVEQEDASVGQGTLAEIPVENVFKGTHTNSFVFLGKGLP
jgi:hypothetical protein